MVQCRGSFGLLDKSPFAFGVSDLLRWEHFEGDKAVQVVSRALYTTPMPPSPSFSRIDSARLSCRSSRITRDSPFEGGKARTAGARRMSLMKSDRQYLQLDTPRSPRAAGLRQREDSSLIPPFKGGQRPHSGREGMSLHDWTTPSTGHPPQPKGCCPPQGGIF